MKPMYDDEDEEDYTPVKKTRYSAKKLVALSAGVTTVAVLAILAIIFFIIFGTSHVSRQSMEPTYQDGRTVLFLRLQKDFRPGDVVAVKLPNGDQFIKRIIGVPGDTIDIRDGNVYVNGEELTERYIQGVTETVGKDVVYPLTLGDNKYFVLGDNREHSTDSRTFGPIDISQIRGKVLS